MRLLLPLFLALAICCVSPAQTVDAFMDANLPGQGASTPLPFGGGVFSTTQNTSGTTVQHIPASYLASAGLVSGATLNDLALAPTATGTLTCPQLHAVIGHAMTPWDPSQFLGNIGGFSTIYDSALLGSMTWALTKDVWNNLNTTSIGFVWDGVSDLALYISTGNVSFSASSPTGPVISIQSMAMRHAGGVSARNTATGFAATTPTTSDNKGLRLRMTFTNSSSIPPGTVTFSPAAAVVSPGSPLVVTFSSPQRAGDFYIPYIACLPGLTPVTGTPFMIPLAWDSCTDFYFLDPNGLSVFQLGAPGQYSGTLNSTGMGVGIINIPPGLLPSLTIPVHITFLTSDVNGVNQVHGIGTCTIMVP